MNNFLYEVIITMNDKNYKGDKVKDFIESELTGVDIVNIDNNVATLSWQVNENEGPNEIEEALYYVLDDGKLGTYTYHRN